MTPSARRRNRRIAADVFSETVAKYGLCPNRLWAVAGESLDEILPDGALPGHRDHDTCTFDFCEWSQKDFTAVGQRHECEDTNECQSLLFPKAFLDEGILQDKSVAWKLDGSSLIDWPQSYMAVSHVWSDGTGAGAWPDGEVNECLFAFFRQVARQFSCDGIWWDTICIPRGKVARNKAIDKMHNNYQDARITLVHDCFLRSWNWVDAETACFVILLSPWFSRGWTALELAMSRKVKVIFNGPHNLPVIKDLDEDILAKETNHDETSGPQTRHQKLSRIIRNLRTGITSLDDLLGVLGARYTSWPRDMLTIAKLLVGVELESADKQKPHDLQRNILKKLGSVSPGNLFHSSATISDGTSWCSTRLFDMPKSGLGSSLQVEHDLDLRGIWQPILIDRVLEKSSLLWHQTHPLVKRMLQEHLEEGDCSMLAEVDQSDPSMDLNGDVGRALLVRESDQPGCYEYLGALYFHPKLPRQDISDGESQEIVILGGIDLQTDSSNVEDADEQPKQDQKVQDPTLPSGVPMTTSHGWTDLHYAVWRGQIQIVHTLISQGQIDISARDRLGRQAIHLAAERGNLELVKFLHLTHPSSTDEGVLEWAVWGGSVAVTSFLLDQGYVPANMGLKALEIIAEMGTVPLLPLFTEAIKQLDKVETHSTTPLHIAASFRHADVVAFLANYLTDLNKRNKYGQTALHLASASGGLPVVKLLLNEGNINLGGYHEQTALQQALLSDNGETARFLIESGAWLNVTTSPFDWTPLHFAAYHGDLETAKMLILSSPALVNAADSKVRWTPLHFAAVQGHSEMVKYLLEMQASPEEDLQGWTPGMLASFKGHSRVVEMLGGESINHPGDVARLSRWTDFHFAALDGSSMKQLLDQDSTPKMSSADEAAASKPAHVNPDALFTNTVINPDEKQADESVLSYAAMKNHSNLVRLLLEWDIDINTMTPNGATCLHYAAWFGSIGLVRHLLKRLDKAGAGNSHSKIAAGNPRGETPLHWACMAGARGIVDLLIQRGGDPNARAFSNSYRPIHYAAQRNRIGVVDILIAKGADMMSAAQGNHTGLSLAIEEGHISVVALMIDKGADFLNSQVEGSSMLQLAVEFGHYKIVELLILSGAEVMGRDMSGFTALHYAAWKGRSAIAHLLIDKGADLEAMDDRGCTPLTVATEHLQDSMVSFLLQKGARKCVARLPTRTIDGKSPIPQGMETFDFDSQLFPPVVNGDADFVKSLMKSGHKADVLDSRGRTLIHVAASHGHVHVVQELIKGKFRKSRFLSTKDDYQLTPLAYAAAGGSVDMVGYLLKEMGNADKVNLNEALKYAVIRGHLQVTEVLASAGADFRAHDTLGMPTWGYSTFSGNVSMIQLLVRLGFDLEEVDSHRRRLLHYAACQGDIAILRLLIKRGAEYASFSDNNKISPMQYAAQRSNKATLGLFRDMGVWDLHFKAQETFDERAIQFQATRRQEEEED